MIRVCSKLVVVVGFSIQIEILALLKGQFQATYLGIFNLLVEGDSIVAISWMTKKGRGHDNSLELGFSLCWAPYLTNHITDA